MREYFDSGKNKLSFIIDEDADRPESFAIAKSMIEQTYPSLVVKEDYPPFWNTGKFLISTEDDIEIELFFSEYFGGTEILIDNNLIDETKNKVRQLAGKIYNAIHNNEPRPR